jgi:hypothetical protein
VKKLSEAQAKALIERLGKPGRQIRILADSYKHPPFEQEGRVYSSESLRNRAEETMEARVKRSLGIVKRSAKRTKKERTAPK